ncbi:MAG: hypothetical protein ACRDYW_03490 [Acidimicrobiales bacterium]
MSQLRSRAVILAVAAGALGACANGGTPGIRVEALQADIVFGVEQPEDAAIAPVDAPSLDGSGPREINPSLNVPFRNRIPDRFKNILDTVPGSAVQGACPTAPAGASPRVAAERNASTPPLAGLYRYRVSGTQTFTIDGTEITSPVSGFEPRIVRAVESTGPSFWTFEVLEPTNDGTRVTQWSVNTDPSEVPSPTSNDSDGDGIPDGRGVGIPYIGQNPIRAGEPGRGVALETITDYDDNGNVSGSFSATPSLLFLPLPVLPGEEFQSAAVDRQGQSMQLDGQVERTQTVDACGELADGWFVSMAVVTAQSLGSTASNEEWIFSTPMGGLPISHRVQQTYVDPTTGNTVTQDITYSLAQIDPATGQGRFE